MRKTKSILCVLLAAMLMLSLTACVRNPDATTALPSETGSGTATTAPAATSAPEGVKVDLNDGWTIGFASSGSFSDVGYYYIHDHFLYFMDTENGTSVILCSKAGCRHNATEDYEELKACEAYFRPTTVFFYYDEHLYYDKYDADNPNAVNLYRRNADGTGEEKVATLCEEYFSQTSEVVPGPYIIADGMMYYAASINGITESEPNNFEIQQTGGLLMRLDLETGKEKEILRMNDIYIQLFAAREDAIIFYTQELLPPDEMMSPDLAKLFALPARLQIWTESSGEAELIFEKTCEKCWTMLNIYGGKLYYFGTESYAHLYAYDIATGERTTPDLPGLSGMINDDYWYAHGERNTTIYDFRTGKPVPGDFADWKVYIPEVGEKGFVAEFWLITDISPEGEIILESKIRDYVPFAALEDGLQKEDIRIISEKEY